MTTPLQAADHYVRHQTGAANLQNYLDVIARNLNDKEDDGEDESVYFCGIGGAFVTFKNDNMDATFKHLFYFDLDTGSPLTNEDARKFLELCEVDVNKLGS